MEEIWKDIEGYEGLYQVSNLGNIRSIKIRNIHNDDGRYKTVNLIKNNKTKKCKIHRLVAQAFIPNPNNYPIVNHKDENKSNNNANNLEWCSYKYNSNYGTSQERRLKTLLNKNSYFWKKRKVNQYDLEGKFIKEWNSIKEASIKLNITKQHISDCCRNLRKTAGKYIWKYK